MVSTILIQAALAQPRQLTDVFTSGTPASAFAHSVGYTAPNVTTNVGADVTLTPHLVATTRFGYYFENYHDFGYPTNNTLFIWQNNGMILALPLNDHAGNPLPASLQHGKSFR